MSIPLKVYQNNHSHIIMVTKYGQRIKLGMIIGAEAKAGLEYRLKEAFPLILNILQRYNKNKGRPKPDRWPRPKNPFAGPTF